MTEHDNSEPPLNRTYCPALSIIPPDSSSRRYDEALSYFRSLSWCANLLDAPNTFSYLPNSRNPASNDRDQFLSITLATDTALKHILCLFSVDDPAHVRDPTKPITKVHTLFALEEGLGGVGPMAHGGVIMTLLDESANVLLEINTVLGKEGGAFTGGSVTGGMEVKFQMPVLTGATALVTSDLESVKGRRARLTGVVKNEDGDELVKATSTWFAVRSVL